MRDGILDSQSAKKPGNIPRKRNRTKGYGKTTDNPSNLDHRQQISNAGFLNRLYLHLVATVQFGRLNLHIGANINLPPYLFNGFSSAASTPQSQKWNSERALSGGNRK